MRYKHETNHLYLYIAFSLLIHILTFILIPYGVFTVMGNSPEGEEYGFIQLVEYRREIGDTGRQTNNRHNTETNTVIEDRKQETEIIEEKQVREERKESERKEETIKETISPETPKVEEEIPVKPVEEIEQVEEVLVEESSAIEEGSEILTSTESDLEIEIDVQSDEEPVKQKTESKPIVEEKVETPPAPPPPPKAGDLVFGAAPITYPKDMVGQAVTGIVEIQVYISSSGLIEGIEIIKSSGIEQMDRVARLTIEHGWQFKQFQQPYSMIITVNFKIDELGNPEVEVSQGNLVFR